MPEGPDSIVVATPDGKIAQIPTDQLPPELAKLLPEHMKLTPEEREELLMMDIRKEYFDLARRLDIHHAFFYKLWELGTPRLTFAISTAAVGFDRKGHQIAYLFNPLFWKDCDTYKKVFVICHEFLHILLNHGIRSKDCDVPQLANIALDVVVNHMLVDKFGFDRTKIKGWEDLCWLDTTFKDFDDVLLNNFKMSNFQLTYINLF